MHIDKLIEALKIVSACLTDEERQDNDYPCCGVKKIWTFYLPYPQKLSEDDKAKLHDLGVKIDHGDGPEKKGLYLNY